MKLLKRWYYPVLLITAGIFYLSATGSWGVYTEQLHRLQELADTLPGRTTQKEEGAGAHGLDRGQENTPGEDAPEHANGQQESETGLPDEEKAVDGAGESEGTKALLLQRVDSSYFEDAIFIGDSRTVGLYEYGELGEEADFFASTGMSVYKLFREKLPMEGEKKKKTLEEVLTARQYGKIYIMLGINEMGTGTLEAFVKKYGECIQRIRELQPDAVIFLQAVMEVSAERSGQGDYVTNEGIRERNSAIREMADGVTYIFLDVNPLLCDEEGGLKPDYSYDGVHLKAQYVEIWENFLMDHGVVK